MKPIVHARNSVRKWGGVPEDYLKIHDFIDSSKACYPDVAHRALLHSSFGVFLVEQVFGPVLVLSTKREVSTKDVAELHIAEDMGFIPRVDQWLVHMQVQPWMEGRARKRVGSKGKFIPID